MRFVPRYFGSGAFEEIKHSSPDARVPGSRDVPKTNTQRVVSVNAEAEKQLQRSENKPVAGLVSGGCRECRLRTQPARMLRREQFNPSVKGLPS